MKRIALYIISIVLLAACQEQIDSTPQLKEAGTLEVSFAYGDSNNVKSHTFTPSSQSVEIEVKMNVEVGWMVSSNAEWCVVDEEEVHHGNGTFTLAVKANDGFFDRNDATVTLSAGDFSTCLSVIQHGNVFILDREYHMSNKVSGSTDLKLGVREGVNWDLECPEWITARQSEGVSADGQVNTVITFEWDENQSTSRFGTVGFIREGDKEASVSFSLFQFGSEYATTEDGTILLDAEKPMPVEVRVPVNTFTAIDCPNWVTYEPPVANDDKTESWYLYFAENPSDTESLREAEIEFVAGSSANKVVLPAIKQNFYPAGGLLTAAGFKMFSERFNSNGDISSWVNNGVVNIVGHVDMSGLEEWTPIGTEDRPFDLKFDGRFMTISNFKYSSPLFGVCKDADISGVIFDQSCSIERDQNFVDHRYLAPLAQQIINTQVKDCKSNASVGLMASAVADGCNVYLSGLVGYVDENSTISDCTVGGSITSLSSKEIKSGGSLYIGGIAGHSYGNIEACESAMTIADSVKVSARYVGGIVGLNDGGKLANLKNKTAIQIHSDAESKCLGGVAGKIINNTDVSGIVSTGAALSSTLFGGTNVYVGGLIGYVDNELNLDFTGVQDSDCTISVAHASNVYTGGVLGYATGAITLKSPRLNGNITYDISSADVTAQVGVSGLVGRSCAFLNVDDASVSGKLTIKANSSKKCMGAFSAGGVVAIASVGAEIKNSTNKCEISWSAQTANSNGNISCIGGIAGRIEKGVSSIKGCTNEAYINNRHYNNNGYSKGKISGNRVGGIIGTYGYEANLSKKTSNFVMSECHNTFEVNSIRGFCGGLAGFLVNADVKNCTYKGAITKKYANSYAAGIAAGVENTTIENCDVLADLYGQYGGSCFVRVGGIAAIFYLSSEIKNCRYFGDISIGTASDSTIYGCLVGDTEEGCSISNSGIGGTLPGVEVTSTDYEEYFYGLGLPKDNPQLIVREDRPNITIGDDCYYWNGK